MAYYKKVNGEVLLTEAGHFVLSFFGLSLEDLQVMSKEQLIAHTKKFSDCLNDGKITKGTGGTSVKTFGYRNYCQDKGYDHITEKAANPERTIFRSNDEGSYSRYFSLDAWADKTFPFIITPKASRSERNKGCESMEKREGGIGFRHDAEVDGTETMFIRTNPPDKKALADYLKEWRHKKGLSSNDLAKHFPSVTGGITGCIWNWEHGANMPTKEEWLKLKQILGFDDRYDKQMTEFIEVKSNRFAPSQPRQNHHPTVKPLKLMSYLITMGSREGDLVLDPFCGSGTVCIAADQLHRKWIGIEKNEEYAAIIKKRLMVPLSQLKLSVWENKKKDDSDGFQRIC